MEESTMVASYLGITLLSQNRKGELLRTDSIRWRSMTSQIKAEMVTNRLTSGMQYSRRYGYGKM